MICFYLGFGFTASLVVLFMQFYKSTYNRPAAAAAAVANGKSKAH